MLQRFGVLMTWCRMKFKPKKFRSLSEKKGMIDATTTFTVTNQQIPMVNQEPDKSLGRYKYYDSSIKIPKEDSTVETVELAIKG